MRRTCPYCGHHWNYGGKSIQWITCPGCYNKINMNSKKGRTGKPKGKSPSAKSDNAIQQQTSTEDRLSDLIGIVKDQLKYIKRLEDRISKCEDDLITTRQVAFFLIANTQFPGCSIESIGIKVGRYDRIYDSAIKKESPRDAVDANPPVTNIETQRENKLVKLPKLDISDFFGEQGNAEPTT